MALFSSKKEEKQEASSVKEVRTLAPKKGVYTKKGIDLTSVIRRPRITEKATNSAEKGTYVFEVNIDATKIDIAEAVKILFKVTPVKINVVRMKSQNIIKRSRGVKGKSKNYKKAYVFLKKGDKIELI